MKVQFNSQELKGHKDSRDKFLKVLKENYTNEEAEYFLAALLLALSTKYSEKWKDKAKEIARTTLENTPKRKKYRCKKCDLVGHFNSNKTLPTAINDNSNNSDTD